MVYRPAPFDVPEDLRPFVESSYAAIHDNVTLVEVDLNQDETPEYVVIGSTDSGLLRAEGFYRQGDEWLSLYMPVGTGPDASGTGLEPSLQSGAIEAISPEFQTLRIGDVEFNVYPHR